MHSTLPQSERAAPTSATTAVLLLLMVVPLVSVVSLQGGLSARGFFEQHSTRLASAASAGPQEPPILGHLFQLQRTSPNCLP